MVIDIYLYKIDLKCKKAAETSVKLPTAGVAACSPVTLHLPAEKTSVTAQ